MTAYIYDGLRSPFGRHGGALAGVRPDDLLAEVVHALVVRNPFALEDYEDLIAGCASQAGEDGRNLAHDGRRPDRQPLVRLGPGSGAGCGSRGEERRGRAVHCRRRGKHEPRPLRGGQGGLRLVPRFPGLR
ncbi:3-oxoadipyl-CoA/3-oxo-5,6-dehydrosuberyl-CoA thiolase [compost metagenome]